MGFTKDVAITTDDDFFKYAFEQDIPALLRETGKSDFSDIHKAAVNVLIRDLKLAGYDPSTITNTDDFKEELVYWCLRTIFRGEVLAGNVGAQVKYEMYEMAWKEAKDNRIVEDTSQTTEADLPLVANADRGAYFKGQENAGQRFMQSEIDNYDGLVFDNPS